MDAPTGRELAGLHAGLLLANVFWSIMHVVLSGQLRRGVSPAIVALYRELVGAASLLTIAKATETRPPMTWAVYKLLATAGAIFCGIRLTILQGLVMAGPDITAALVPLTPIFTLGLALALGRERVRWRTRAGQQLVGGMALCTLFACLMGVLKGPLLFGNPKAGADSVAPPSNIPEGVAWMLLQCFLAAWVQLVNRRTLTEHHYPLVSTTAGVAAFACLFLFPFAVYMAPAASWTPTPGLIGAVIYAGFFATAMNNIMLARANRRLGSTTANLWMPAQGLITAVIDYLTLGDAVYTASVICGIGVTLSLALAVVGKSRGDAEAAADEAALAAQVDERAAALAQLEMAEGVPEGDEAATEEGSETERLIN